MQENPTATDPSRSRIPLAHLIPSFMRHVGPGVVTGAAGDDPSGVANNTQAGAQFGSNTLWSVFLTLPFMVACPRSR